MRSPAVLLSFIAAATVAALAGGMAFSGLSHSLGVWACVIGLLVAIPVWRKTQPEEMRLRFWDWLMLALFAMVSLRSFLWLIYPRGDELLILSPNNFGDLAMHVNFIRYFASGIPFWPDSPLLTGAPLSYPLGMDLFNSVLEVLGMDTFRGLIWTGLIGAALSGFALWRWGGAFGLAAFLFNGGLLGFAFFKTLEVEDFQHAAVWKNLFLAMFITQRGFLFALPAGLLLLATWRDTFFRGAKNVLPVWVQLFLYAVMPLFSIHAFLFLSFMLLAIFCANSRARKPLLIFVGAAFIPATILVWLVTAEFSVSSGFRWIPGWIMEGMGWSAWPWNFGITLPLVLALAAMLLRDRDPEARCHVWAALLIFIFCCLFAMAPWPWDNMKLMMWSWLVIAPYLWSKMISQLKMPARIAVCFLLFFSGAVSLLGGLDGRHGYVLARKSELAAWQHATRLIPPEARFAIVPDFNHPLLLLGRKVACGYEGHLWTHGLEYKEKFQALDAALHGRLSWREAAPALGVDWLALRSNDIFNTTSPDLVLPDPPHDCLYDLRPLNQERPDSQGVPLLQPQSED